MALSVSEFRADVVVIGGGIVGLSTAWALLQKSSKLKVVVLEKESSVGAHQTGHNSGVIHSGLYYKPGSLKAKNCLDGYARLLKFCQDNQIAHEICGKLVVATNHAEVSQLEMLFQRGSANGLSGIRKLSSGEIREIEPHCSGVAGLFVPQTGIVDYRSMIDVLKDKVSNLGGDVRLNTAVIDIDHRASEVIVSTSGGEFIAQTGGLMCWSAI